MEFNELVTSLITHGKYFLVGTGIGIGFYYAKFTMPFLKWLKGGIENQDGQLANRDLQIAFVSCLVGYIVVTASFGSEYADSIIWGGWGTLAGLYGIKEIYGKKDSK